MDVSGVAHEEQWHSQMQAGREVEGQKPKTELNGLDLGYIRVLRDAGGLCEVKDPLAVVI